MRILLVDDEADLLDAVARGLRREGYAVDTAMDGEEALAKASYTPYDLICLDLTMPGIDGLSSAGVPSSLVLVNSRDRVARNPPEAGPKPTQTMSASIFGRSISGFVLM